MFLQMFNPCKTMGRILISCLHRLLANPNTTDFISKRRGHACHQTTVFPELQIEKHGMNMYESFLQRCSCFTFLYPWFLVANGHKVNKTTGHLGRQSRCCGHSLEVAPVARVVPGPPNHKAFPNDPQTILCWLTMMYLWCTYTYLIWDGGEKLRDFHLRVWLWIYLVYLWLPIALQISNLGLVSAQF